MYLKSLELQGFKSFPDRTVIRFSDGMTAIVGPNGSGKSNISDAVRWVLGEQSTKSLRGEKMEDVIFGGTARRNRMGFAQVTLILDNSGGRFPLDAAEVMVSRRFYRSGESEYRINGKRARLKDVRELFMDTGLGRDGYSVIGQGRIDEILSAKSVDRREIFEEAAGVTKFRTRKGEAEKRLEQTDANLVRIRDIWNELNERSGPLQQQAETAKRFLKLHDELRVHEVSLWMDSLNGMAEALKQSEEREQTVQADLTRVRAEQEQSYRTVEQLELAMQQAEVRNEELRARRGELEREQAERARRMAVLEESSRNAENNRELAKQQAETQTEQKRTIAEQRAAREARMRELQETIDRIAREQKELSRAMEQSAQSMGHGQREMEQLRQQAAQHAERMYRLQNDQTAVETQRETMEQRQGSLAEELRQAQERAEQERTAQDEMERIQTELEEDVQTQQELLCEEQERLREATQQLHEARQQYTQKQGALQDSRNRIRMLTELQKDYEGFSRAVKKVMNRAESGKLDGVHGPVSSLIQVADDYVTAIETALGAAASNIIVDTPQDAKRAIELLKRTDGGRATFLPVDTIRPMQLRENGLEQQDGFCGIAAELTSYDTAYHDIIWNLLGRTVIVRTLDDAIAMGRRFRNRFRIVTLDGQVVQAGGSLTGGSVGRSSGILSRANQLQALQRQEKTQSAELETLAERGAELAKQTEEGETVVQDITDELGAVRQKLAAQQAAAQQHRLLMESVESSLTQLVEERDNADRLRAEFETRIASLAQEMEQAERDKQDAEDKIHQVEQAGQAVSEKMRQLSERAAAKRTESAQAETERQAHEQALHDLDDLMQRAQQTADDAERRMAEYLRQQESDRRELEQLETQGTGLDGEREQLSQELRAGIEQRTRLERNKTEENKKVQGLSSQVVSLEREAARTEAATEKLRTEEKQLLDTMWNSYELTPTAAQSVAQKIENRPETEQRASTLRRQIRQLGPVNLAAVEEYDELSERLTFLTGQKDDLEQAETELREIIAQLTVQMQEVFVQSFAQLNQYFGETFQEMFGGGTAELCLEDEHDVLGCGIEIRVTPPGKAVKSLSLLSGGEKAFVAIALYFAIIKVRPTPFCILDEIEAALDDVNVTRYAKYLRRLSDKTQFIVITHRRGTMEEADMLYGVTMQERGVSKLLMLNIREVEEKLQMKAE